MLIEDDPKVQAAVAKITKAKEDLKALIGSEEPDATKWKIEEVVAHIRVIETLLQIR